MRNSVIIDGKDNVAVAVEKISAGEQVCCLAPDGAEVAFFAVTDIPIYHKVAARRIGKGEKIVKYGEHIGEAGCEIEQGAHVHIQNVISVREDLG